MQSSRRATAVVTTLLVSACVAAQVLPRPGDAAPSSVVVLPALPNTLATLQAANPRLPDETTPALRVGLAASTSIATRTYRDPQTGSLVQVTRLCGTDRDALHDPRSCFVGVGWRIGNESTVTASGVPVHLGRLEKPGSPTLLVAYAYVLGDHEVIADPTRIRALLLWQALIGAPAKHIVYWRLLTPASGGAASGNRLSSLLGSVVATAKR